MPETDKSARQRVAIADVQPLLGAAACAPCAVAAPRVKNLIVLRIADDADFALTLQNVGNRHAVIACAAQKVVRAVDRVDYPQARVGAGEAGRGLFAHECVARKFAPNLGTNQRLDGAIGVTDEVLRAFGFDRQRAAADEIVVRDATCLDGDGLCGGVAGSYRHGFLRRDEVHHRPTMVVTHRSCLQ